MHIHQVTAERRQWKRFGAAAKETAADSVTVRTVEEIPFERIRPAKATAQEKKFTDMQAALQSADKSAIVGRCVCRCFGGWGTRGLGTILGRGGGRA